MADEPTEVSVRGTSRVPTRPSQVDVIREAERNYLQGIVNATGGESRFTIEEMQRALAEGPPRETVERKELEESGFLEPKMRGFFEEIGMSGEHGPVEEAEAPPEVEARVAIGSSAIIGGPGAGSMAQKNFVDLVNRQTKQPIGRFRVGDYVPGLGNIDDIGERVSRRPGRPEIDVPAIRIVPDDKSVKPYWIMGHDLVPPGTEDVLAQRMDPEGRWGRGRDAERAFGNLMLQQTLANIESGDLGFARHLSKAEEMENYYPFGERPPNLDLIMATEQDLLSTPGITEEEFISSMNEIGDQVPSWQSDLDQGLLADDQQVADDELLQDLMGLEAGSSEEAAMRSMRRENGDAAAEEVYGVRFDGEDFVAVDTAGRGTYYYNSDTGESFWGDTEG